MTHIEDVLVHALAQQGDRYDNTVATDLADPDPEHFDCSGLIRWSCARAGVKPLLPWSAFMQAQRCIANGTGIGVDQAIATRGALLFKFPDVDDVMALTSRPAGAHVAWSLGDGTTMEAMGRTRPVGVFKAHNRQWTHGGLVPGVVYVARPPVELQEEEEEMTKILYFSGPGPGEVHPYVVAGCVGKHLSPAGLNLHALFKTETVGSPETPLGKEWQDCVALLDGPLRNVA